MEQGIFITGRLIGTKVQTNTKRNSTETYSYDALGIDLPITNSFGVKTTITKEVRVSKDKMKDSSFIKSVQDNLIAIVKLEVGVGDYQNIFVSRHAILEVIEPSIQSS